MDVVSIVKELGVPIAMLLGFSWYIIQRTKFLETTLMKEVDEDFNRLEGILIKLIDQIKLSQLDTKELKGYIMGIQDILTKYRKD
tara:strand:+ start:7311 stop:7565 length:255 start_codon:yes stop_codon:yes gene_type:complete